MPTKIAFSITKKLRSRSSAKKDGEVLLVNEGESRPQDFHRQPSRPRPPPPQHQHQRNPRNGKLNSAPLVNSKTSNAAPSSPIKESSKANSRRKAEAAAAAVPRINLMSAISHSSSKATTAIENEVQRTTSSKSAIFSTSFNRINHSDDDYDNENQFFFPSFDKNIDNEFMWMDDNDGGDAQRHQQQQSDQTFTTCSNSISGSHIDGHEDSHYFTEEGSADPPAILDLDEDQTIFDDHFGAQEEEGTVGKREQSGKTTKMFFMQNNNHECEAHHLVRRKTPHKNEFWLSSSSSSSFFGLSSTSQTQSNDNDEESNNIYPSWEQSRMNNHRREVSPSPSPSAKIQSTFTTTTSTAAIKVSAIVTPWKNSPKQKSNQEEEDLAAWGEIISAIQKSPTESISDSQTNNAKINGADIFSDSFFNNGFSSSVNIHDQEEPKSNNNNKYVDEFAVKSALEDRSVGSDDAIFFSADNASWSNAANASCHLETNEGNEQDSETNIEHFLSSTGEDAEESTLLPDTSFNYSLSNEDPPKVVTGDGKHWSSDGDVRYCDEGPDDVGRGIELSTAIVAAPAMATSVDLPAAESLGHNTIENHKDSLNSSKHSHANVHTSHEPNPRRNHQPQHHQHQQQHHYQQQHQHQQQQHQQQQHQQQQHQQQRTRRRMLPSSLKGHHDNLVDISTLSDDADIQFLLANLEATIGPRGVAPDMESLSGRSSVRSARSARSDHGQQHQHHHQLNQFNDGRSFASKRDSGSGSTSRQQYSPSGGASVDSRASRSSKASRKSYRSHQSTRSALTSMSKETRIVANDLFRLEAQLADQVDRQQRGEEILDDDAISKSKSRGVCDVERGVGVTQSSEEVTSSSSGEPDISTNTQPLGATPAPRPNTHFEVIAPPGKLGILLSNVKTSNHERSGGVINKHNNNTGPTHVSSVRSTSVLAGRVHVGDIFLSIDGEDVTGMNSVEITHIMARKSDSPRVLKLQPLVNSTVAQWQEWI